MSINEEDKGRFVEALFGRDGPFARTLQAYEERPQQTRLALEVARALSKDDGFLLAAEAPTGVGKSFALLVPALFEALEKEKRVLVLTAGIPLQEQLLTKDLPFLAETLKLDLSFGLLKGRRNYACLLKAQDLSGEGYLSFNDGGFASARIAEWAAETETGDLSELDLAPAHPAVARISSSHRGCLGGSCPFHDRCFVVRALQKAQGWQVVIANYHLFFSYVLGARRPFPVPFDILLCDEAHHMAEAARASAARKSALSDWSRLFSRAHLSRFALFFDEAGLPSQEVGGRFNDCLQSLTALFDKASVILNRGRGLDGPPQVIRGDLERALQAVESLERTAAAVVEGGDDPVRAEFLLWRDELREAREDLSWCLAVSDFPGWAYWWDGESLTSAPTLSSSLVRDALEMSSPDAIVAASATMTVEGDFRFWSRETGLEPDGTLCLDSPFDLPSQMETWIVDVGLTVRDEGYDERVARVVEKLCDDNGGSSLVLLSSLRLLKSVGQRLKRRKKPYQVFVQGDLPRGSLLTSFREDLSSVLVGSVSFREGIDIPGEGLTQVIVDRIPFPHPQDPLVEARSRLEGSRSFATVTLPWAKLYLKQALGRLIRSSSDRGRAVILDSRVLTRPGWRVVESLPPVPLRRVKVRGVKGQGKCHG